MIALRGVHIHEMDANSAFSAMPDDGTHLKSSAEFSFLNPEMNFDLRSDSQLLFAQDTHSNRTQVRKETRREIAWGTE